MRPIDADALIEKCGGWYVEEGTESGFIGTLKNLLSTMPTIQPEKAQLSKEGATSDLISRQAAIDAVDKYDFNIPEYMEGFVTKLRDAMKEDLREDIAGLPSVQPERKKGEWLPDNNSAYEMRFICSCCKESEVVPTIGFTKYKPLWDFCPNCGADMRGEKDG